MNILLYVLQAFSDDDIPDGFDPADLEDSGDDLPVSPKKSDKKKRGKSRVADPMTNTEEVSSSSY